MSPPQVCPGELAAEEGSHRVPHLLSRVQLRLSAGTQRNPPSAPSCFSHTLRSIATVTHSSQAAWKPGFTATANHIPSVPSALSKHQNPTKNRRNKSQRQTDPRAAPESRPCRSEADGI
ncbi:hypothetical protein KUCAC02_034174 [Chaenocephalus aceratus]|nr:hypothetical protein KUCAC02_034174 [Chaenocephalus aceratus]